MHNRTLATGLSADSLKLHFMFGVLALKWARHAISLIAPHTASIGHVGAKRRSARNRPYRARVRGIPRGRANVRGAPVGGALGAARLREY